MEKTPEKSSHGGQSICLGLLYIIFVENSKADYNNIGTLRFMTSAADIATQLAHLAALQWHVDQGMDEVLADEPGALMRAPSQADVAPVNMQPPESVVMAPRATVQLTPTIATISTPAAPLQGTPELKNEAIRLAIAALTREDLAAAIAGFDGIAIKKTATNMVFSDGNPSAPVMLIGEAPGADEDRLGQPFAGANGQLLDKILKGIDLDRTRAQPEGSIYISNILNWRPPGNRTPTDQEVELSLPFIERHIALVKPKLLILCGGASAKALLNTNDSMSKLRGRWHTYQPRTPGIEGAPIPTIATYNLSYLLQTPIQKRAVWQDMLTLKAKLQEMGLQSEAA